MATIAVLVGGAILNAAAFTGGGNYLMHVFGGSNKAIAEKKRHDLAEEAFDRANERYQRERAKLLDWIASQEKSKEKADQDFSVTDASLKRYGEAHPDFDASQLKKPAFSDFYTPSKEQQANKLLFVGGGGAAVGLAAGYFFS